MLLGASPGLFSCTWMAASARSLALVLSLAHWSARRTPWICRSHRASSSPSAVALGYLPLSRKVCRITALTKSRIKFLGEEARAGGATNPKRERKTQGNAWQHKQTKQVERLTF